jgi:C1A family cysteine protease
VRELVLPFASGRLYSGELETFYATAALLKISMYVRLDSPSQWRDWLARNGPIATRLDVDETWDGAKAALGNLDVYKPDTKRGGHAVAIVGYTPDRFIIRNSWGTTWGDQGFGYASFEYADDAFTEAYGVVVA